MSLASGIYVGRVRHRRTRPRAHDFAYRLHMLYLDLDELDLVFAGRWLWSTGRRNLFAWHRADYFGDPRVPLRDAVLDRVSARYEALAGMERASLKRKRGMVGTKESVALPPLGFSGEFIEPDLSTRIIKLGLRFRATTFRDCVVCEIAIGETGSKSYV